MKKARKKRIVRRKRRFSEREVMRIKRKLKKSARKLRLGAKRTGAYVYGTLRRIVGNPYTADQRRRIVEAINECNAYIRKESARRADIRPREAQEHLDFCRAHKQKLLKMLGYDVAERYLKGNPYSKTRGWYGPKATQGMTPQEKLRYYVSGAIARGEAEPIVGTPAHRPIPQVEPAWKYGIYTGRSVVKKNPLEKMGVYAGRDGFEITDFKKGDRIQLHPGMDLWMRGAKYGQIIGIGRKKLQVKLDYLRRPIAISPRNIGEIMYREIGENRRRTAGRRRMVRVLGYDVVEGSKKHMRLLEQKRHFNDLQRSERGLRGNPGKLFPASYPPEKKLILFLARREGWKKYKVSRTGTYPFELRIDGVGKNDIQFSGLLKLIAIHSLVNWTSPQVAMMSSYPSMAREGDWSGIRDSSDEAIDNIFYNFVLKPLGIAKPISR